MRLNNLIFFILLILSCHPQIKQQDKLEINKENVTMLKILFNFYPSSGGNIIYSIKVENDSLEIINHEGENIAKNSFKKRLNKDEINEIIQLIDKIEKRKNIETEIVLDSWRTELLINNEIFYNKSDVRIQSLPEDISKLFKNLIKDSSVKIELYDFS